MRVGIVGAGNWAIGRADRFNRIDGCRVVLGWSRSEASRERFQLQTGAAAVADWQAVCTSDDVDAVLVATPHVFHFDHARAALRAGKHVIVETPLCLEYGQARELADLAGGRGLVVHHAAKWRYHPDHAAEIDSLRRVGPLVYAERVATFDGGPDRPWYRDFALSGGASAFLSYVAVDFFEAFGRATEAAGLEAREGKLDVATLCVHFAGGGQARISYGTGEGIAGVDSGLAIGRDGAIAWGMGQPKQFIRGDDTTSLPALREMDIALVECQAFVDEIRGTREFRPDLELDLHILETVSLARQNIVEGTPTS